jgi:hypothetical protein
MKKAVVALTVVLLTAAAFAQESGADGEAPTGRPGALFIGSAPIRAEVVLDGTPIGQTPLFVESISAGDHEITLIKPGHLQHIESVTVAPGETVQFSTVLEPSVFVGAFAAPETIVDGQSYSRQDSRLILPAGTYEFSQTGSSLTLNPVYPYESALRSLRVAAPVVAIAAIIATVEDIFVNDSASFFTSRLPSPATFATWTAAAASGGFLIALSQDKKRYEAETVVRRYETPLTDAEAERFYLIGERSLEAGNLETALTNYTRVVVEGGDSEYVPLALYKAARIYTISGETELALPLFELLVRDYPVPDTYDRALKSISDILVTRERYEEAIQALERMVFADDLYDPQTVRSDISTIRSLMSGEDTQ